MKKLFLSAMIVAGSIASFAQTNATTQPVRRSAATPTVKEGQASKMKRDAPALNKAETMKNNNTTNTKAATPVQKTK